MRRFRVDRLRAMHVVEGADAGSVAPHVPRVAEDGFLPGPGAVEVQLHLGKGAQWVAESVPVRSVVRATDGTVTDVVLDVAGMAWFERLLLQLGTEARVVRPAELTGLAARAAQKVLRLYEDDA
jgi:predicted DNA-binding transcriptional regulator YafY